MIRTPLLLTILISLFIISGCTSLKRHKSAQYVEQNDALVDMDLFGYQLSEAGSTDSRRNLWELSASAQTQLIQILDTRFEDNYDFISSLSNDYLLTDEGAPIYDYTSKDLRMVFTIRKQRDYTGINKNSNSLFSPADRIEYLKFSVEIPPEAGLDFIQWNKYSTEFGSIDIGEVSFNRSFGLDAEGSGEKENSASGKVSLSRAEKQGIQYRYLKLNGSISEKRLEIEEEGTRETDLTGNVVADVSLRFTGFPDRLTLPLFGSDSDVPGLRFVDAVIPGMETAPDTIKAILRLEFVYRHVGRGRKTFHEWDDRVQYYSGSAEKEIPLFTKKEYLPPFYCIGTDHDEIRSIRIHKGGQNEFPLHFKDYSDASRFFNWLSDQLEPSENEKRPLTIGEYMLLFDGKPLTSSSGNLNLKVMPAYR